MRWYIFSFLLFFVGSLIVCSPLLQNPTRNVVDDYDGVFIAWSIDWASYTLTHTPLKFFDAPIFYPLQKTFTFSDPMITAALIATPFLFATHEPLVAHTSVIFVSYLLFGWFTCLFVQRITKSWLLGVGIGMYATFGSYHTMYMGHLHTFMLQWIPLSLLSWSLYMEHKHTRWLWIWAVSFIFTVINSPFSGFLFLTSQGIWFFDPESKHCIIQHWKKFVLPLVAAFGVVFSFYIPYMQSSQLYHSERSIRDAAHVALSFNEVVGLRGFSYGILFFIAVLIYKNSSNILKKGALLVSGIALILSFGPVLKWNQSTVKIPFPIPLPYSLAYYVIPGMKAFRAPSRWIVLASYMTILGTALIVKRRNYKLVVLTIFVLLAIEKPWIYQVFTLHARTERAPVYTWLEEHQRDPVIFFPTEIYDMPNGARKEVLRMIDTLPGDHVLPMFNGYSGFAPRERIDTLITLNTLFPSKEGFTLLQKEGIQTIVIEKDTYTTEQLESVKRMLHIRFEDDYAIVGDVPASN